MQLSRRQFLYGSGIASLSAAAGFSGADIFLRERIAEARGLLTEPLLDETIGRALSAAKAAGATYADIRIVRNRREFLSAREQRMRAVHLGEDFGLGVRVIADGTWGFAATSFVDPKAAERTAQRAVEIARENGRVTALLKRPPVSLSPEIAHVDVWQTPIEKDPFKIPLEEKAELLFAINREAMQVSGVKFCTSHLAALGEWKLFASTEGAYLEQNIVRIGPGYSATAVDSKSGEFESRAHELPPMQAGWEYVERSSLLKDARQIGEQAVEKLKAPSVTPGQRDLILSPSNLWLTIHESVGHPTELDRAMGYEANFAGTSFATPDKLHKLRYAAPQVSLYADKTTPGGLATCAYDDDGVKTQRWDLVRDGLFVGYQTTREQAGWIGEKSSRGTSYADSHKSVPFQRMPNVSLKAGQKPLSETDLIAATDDGIHISGQGSWSIDHQRYNFQFGGQMFHEVKNGKLGRVLRDVAYQANTLTFWHACDLLGGEKSWQLHGSMSDGKGEPTQTNSVSHGCPPARFAKINILNTNARRRA